MYSPIALSLLVVCTSTIALAKLGSPGGPQKLHRDVADSFKVISSYPYSVAISDSDNDGTLECLAANRTAIDEEAQTATMTWILPETEFSPKQEIPFYVRPGAEPGTMDFTVDDDPTLRQGIFYYADDDCVVLDLEYRGHRKYLRNNPKL
ncbi:hypothetical protein V5799_015927 [Amblyomma americanum]|uniref:Lipocalin-5 1 n=1 Tax=Amblyomma americanum TaxID=6943 RepID=A0AAQ4F7L8_AMBAM